MDKRGYGILRLIMDYKSIVFLKKNSQYVADIEHVKTFNGNWDLQTRLHCNNNIL